MMYRNTRHGVPLWKIKGSRKWALLIFMAILLALLCHTAFAAEPAGKYQVVNGSDDKAYLVDTTTGFVWVLTYRTTATGREPIALPYKFIKICPSNSKQFLVEDADSGACMPAPTRNTR